MDLEKELTCSVSVLQSFVPCLCRHAKEECDVTNWPHDSSFHVLILITCSRYVRKSSTNLSLCSIVCIPSAAPA